MINYKNFPLHSRFEPRNEGGYFKMMGILMVIIQIIILMVIIQMIIILMVII